MRRGEERRGEEELNLKIDEEGHLIDEPEKDAGTAEEPVDSETGMKKQKRMKVAQS